MTSTPEPGRGQLLLLFIAGAVSLAALLFSVYEDRYQGELRAGEASPLSFTAPVNLEVVDEVATSQQRQSVREQVPDIYHVDQQAQQLVLAAISAASLPDGVRETLQRAFIEPDGVKAQELPELVDRALAGESAEDAANLRVLLARRLVPTSIPDQLLTEAARNAAAAAVRPVMTFVQAGQLIVREGDTLTANQLSLLQATGLYDPRAVEFRQMIWTVLGSLLLGAVFALALMLVWRFVAPRVVFRQFLFLAVLTFVVMVGQRYALGISQSLIFLPVLPLVVSILVSRSAAILWGVWSSVLFSFLVPAGTEFALGTAVVGSIAAAWFAPQQRSRPSLLVAGAASGAIAVVVLAAMSLLLGGYTVVAVITAAAWLLVGGAVAGMVGMALLSVAEDQFGFLTDFQLLELSNPGTPLLQRLLLEAPGTYQHSLVISNLVEQAVQRIGGNALLARVGALYHDVGKLKRPSFFVENQFGTENPHDRLSPHLSYLIITAHVRDGVELLQEYGLPAELVRFVQEHHGTTVLSYFYKRALEATPSLDELNFRYPGPKPRSRETAVLMLADAVESASRTMQGANQSDIRALIDRLVEQRLRDGQLSESNLNFDDLEKIKATFERLLSAILHRRISYPTPEEIGRLRRGSAANGAGQTTDPAVPAGSAFPQGQRADS